MSDFTPDNTRSILEAQKAPSDFSYDDSLHELIRYAEEVRLRHDYDYDYDGFIKVGGEWCYTSAERIEDVIWTLLKVAEGSL